MSIADSWRSTTIGAIARVKTGKTPPKAEDRHFGGDIPFFKPGDLDADGPLSESQEYVSQSGADLVGVLPVETVLISCIGNLGKVGITAVRSICNQQINAVLPSSAVIPRFVYYWARQLKPWLTENASATTITIINKGRFEKAPISLPPLNEQHRITVKLDSLLNRSRSAREELARIPPLVERYKQAILAAAFRGDLTADWRKGLRDDPRPSEEIRNKIVKERDSYRTQHNIRAKGKNRNIPPALEDLPELPAGWTWLTFDDCAWDLTVGHVGPMKDRYVEAGIPFLRSFNIKPNRIETDDVAFIDERFDRELAKSKLSAGTIVVVRTGAPGVAAVVPEHLDGANCSDLVICRAIESLNPHYGAYYINSAFSQTLVRSVQVGVAQQHFNIGAMSTLVLPFAPTDEQNEIVSCIQRAFESIDQLREEAERAATLLERLNDSTLAKAFRGELVPQDPNDKPISIPAESIGGEEATRPEFGHTSREGKTVMRVTRKKDKGDPMAKKRVDVRDNHLTESLRALGGTADARALWQRSEMDIDEFYKQLRDEMKAGRIEEDASSEPLKLTNAT